MPRSSPDLARARSQTHAPAKVAILVFAQLLPAPARRGEHASLNWAAANLTQRLMHSFSGRQSAGRVARRGARAVKGWRCLVGLLGHLRLGKGRTRAGSCSCCEQGSGSQEARFAHGAPPLIISSPTTTTKSLSRWAHSGSGTNVTAEDCSSRLVRLQIPSRSTGTNRRLGSALASRRGSAGGCRRRGRG